MNKRIKELMLEAGYAAPELAGRANKLAELIVRECIDQVEQSKNSPFVSLDDAKRMAHFVDVTTKKIQKHFQR